MAGVVLFEVGAAVVVLARRPSKARLRNMVVVFRGLVLDGVD